MNAKGISDQLKEVKLVQASTYISIPIGSQQGQDKAKKLIATEFDKQMSFVVCWCSFFFGIISYPKLIKRICGYNQGCWLTQDVDIYYMKLIYYKNVGIVLCVWVFQRMNIMVISFISLSHLQAFLSLQFPFHHYISWQNTH